LIIKELRIFCFLYGLERVLKKVDLFFLPILTKLKMLIYEKNKFIVFLFLSGRIYLSK
jgi:hypothetical protein